jgi:hypothetical protein
MYPMYAAPPDHYAASATHICGITLYILRWLFIWVNRVPSTIVFLAPRYLLCLGRFQARLLLSYVLHDSARFWPVSPLVFAGGALYSSANWRWSAINSLTYWRSLSNSCCTFAFEGVAGISCIPLPPGLLLYIPSEVPLSWWSILRESTVATLGPSYLCNFVVADVLYPLQILIQWSYLKAELLIKIGITSALLYLLQGWSSSGSNQV